MKHLQTLIETAPLVFGTTVSVALEKNEPNTATISNAVLESVIPAAPDSSNASAPEADTSDPPVPVAPSNTDTGLTKREQAERALSETPGDNNCVIAERIGVSDELVRRTRKELETAGRLEPVAAVTKRPAASYTHADAPVGDAPSPA